MAKTMHIPTVADLQRLQRFKDAGVFSAEKQKTFEIKEMAKEMVEEPKIIAQAAAQEVKEAVAEAKTLATNMQTKVAELENKLIAARRRSTPQEMRTAMNELFEKYDFSPAEEMIQMLKDPGHAHYIVDVGMRVRVLSDLQSYVMPKLKSTEIHGEVEHSHTIKILRIGQDGKAQVEDMIAPRRVTTIDVPTIEEARQ
jgi:hypothetical protein